MTRKRCSIEGCNNHVKGVCVTHGAVQPALKVVLYEAS